ncbi:MAG: hypothetical protein EXS37_14195 [Opitutus sp.]|nr:hypothetical protein [Opitutus sp.]
MKALRAKLFLFLPTLILASGCQNTRASRIQENAALFASLDPFTRRLVSDGLFDHGFTPELLYMSMGKPNRLEASETDRGRVEIWCYRNYLYGNESAVKIGGSTPGAKPSGTILSSSAPGGPSLMSTKASPSQPTVTDVNDVTLGTLFIELLEGRVVAARVAQ